MSYQLIPYESIAEVEITDTSLLQQKNWLVTGFLEYNPIAFSLRDIVRRDKHYGVVAHLASEESSYRPVTIAWDSSGKPELFSYTWDEIRVLEITRLPKFVPLQTIVRLENNELYLVEALSLELIQIRRDINGKTERMQFPIEAFKGQPMASRYQPPSELVLSAAWTLTYSDIKVNCLVWLEQQHPGQFLENFSTQLHQELLQAYCNELQQWGLKYSKTDLDAAWKAAMEQVIDRVSTEVGLWGIKKGDRILDHATARWGTVTRFHLLETKPVEITWDDGTCCCYPTGLLLMPCMTRVNFVRLSSNVAYQQSEDGKYFTCFIGFNSKRLAQAWLRPVKKLLGQLGNLVCYESQPSDTGKKYQYQVDNYKHKLLKNRIKYLKLIAAMDLNKPPLMKRSVH